VGQLLPFLLNVAVVFYTYTNSHTIPLHHNSLSGKER
jgi:hypothetical protein